MALFTGDDIACRRGERRVFRGLSFALDPGDALLLGGPNGSGKSSLLRILAGLLPPWSGRLAWSGAETREDPGAHRARLHYVGHLDALKPVLTAAETLAFWAGLRGGAGVASALARFRLGALADTPCRYLSAGQKRRLALARLDASPAPLWLLDEPTTGLDVQSVAEFEALLAEHRAGGGIVALATHIPVALPGAGSLSLADYPWCGEESDW